MIKHYFKSAIRNIIRQKLFSAINIIGLSISLAATFLILLYITHELTYDRVHSKHKRVYRLNSEFKLNGVPIKRNSSPYFLAEELKNNFPEVEAVSRMMTDRNTNESFIKINDNFIPETKEIQITDKGIFDILDIPIISGSKDQIFKDYASCVISETMAKRYFKDEYPIGKTLTYKFIELGTL